RQSTCLNNMKQLGTALMMYAQDYDETFPSWPFKGGATGLFSTQVFKDWGYSSWVPAIMPYVKNKGVFVCPTGPTSGTSWPNQAIAGPKDSPMVVNLAISEYIENTDNGFATIARITGARNGPAEVTVIAESCFNGIYQDWSDGFTIPDRPNNFGLWRFYCANPGGTTCVGRPKGDGVNAGYADGHPKVTPGARIRGGAGDKREYPIVNPNSDVWQ